MGLPNGAFGSTGWLSRGGGGGGSSTIEALVELLKPPLLIFIPTISNFGEMLILSP